MGPAHAPYREKEGGPKVEAGPQPWGRGFNIGTDHPRLSTPGAPPQYPPAAANLDGGK